MLDLVSNLIFQRVTSLLCGRKIKRNALVLTNSPGNKDGAGLSSVYNVVHAELQS